MSHVSSIPHGKLEYSGEGKFQIGGADDDGILGDKLHNNHYPLSVYHSNNMHTLGPGSSDPPASPLTHIIRTHDVPSILDPPAKLGTISTPNAISTSPEAPTFPPAPPGALAPLPASPLVQLRATAIPFLP